MQRQHGQAKWLISLAGTGKPEVDELIQLDADVFTVVLVVFADQPGVEGFVAGGHRRVGRKDGILGDLLARIGKAHPALDAIANAFESEERAMALVHVPTGRLDAQRLQRAHTTDTDDDFLADAHLAATDIKLARNRAVGRVILVRIGVQQKHRHATYLRQPDAREHVAVREIDANREVAAILSEQWLDGQARKIIRRIEMLLPPVGLNLLLEVTMLVKRADADKRDPEVARGLAVIAGKHAEAAGINAQAFVKAEFGREINKRAA